jgi:hypothetical protein
VKHNPPGGSGVLDDLEHVCERISTMHHGGQIEFGGEFQLVTKCRPLHIARGQIAIVVEANLPDPNPARCQLADLITYGGPGACLVRMHSNSRVDTPTIGEIECLPARCEIDAGNDHPVDIGRAFEELGRVRARELKVAVWVDPRHPRES